MSIYVTFCDSLTVSIYLDLVTSLQSSGHKTHKRSPSWKAFEGDYKSKQFALKRYIYLSVTTTAFACEQTEQTSPTWVVSIACQK